MGRYEWFPVYNVEIKIIPMISNMAWGRQRRTKEQQKTPDFNFVIDEIGERNVGDSCAVGAVPRAFGAFRASTAPTDRRQDSMGS